MKHRPNLFLVGAMKSGTTYLSGLLGANPDIFMCHPEEPSYFVPARTLRRIWPYMWEQGFWRCEENYLSLFSEARNVRWVAEASTNYTKVPLVQGVPKRIAAFSPEARIIYVMRDPVKRTISHYWHMVRYKTEHRSLAKAVQQESQYLDVSNYAKQLSLYLAQFGEERVYALTFEELTRGPEIALRKLYDWLEVDSSQTPSRVHEPKHVTPAEVEQARGLGLLQKLRGSRSWSTVSRHVPRTFRRLTAQRATRPIRRDSVDEAEAIVYLRSIQRSQVATLSQMLNRSFSEWTTLFDEPDNEIKDSVNVASSEQTSAVAS